MKPAPLDPIEVLAERINNGPHSCESVARAAGLGHDTVNRWVRYNRVPNFADLDKALHVVGYRIVVEPLPPE